MNFLDALNTIKKSHNIKIVTKDVYEIETNDDKSYLTLKDIGGEGILTDYGTTCDLVDSDEKQLIEICKQNHVNFNNYIIECKYTCENDITNMVNCINTILK